MRKYVQTLLICGLVLGLLCGCGRRTASGSGRRGASQRATTSTTESSSSGRRSATREEILQARGETMHETAPSSASSLSTTAPRQDGSSQGGGGIYTDDRVPNYKAVAPQWEQLRYTWTSKDRGDTLSIEVPVDRAMYDHYRNLARYYNPENYFYYVNDSNNEALAAEFVKQIKQSSTVFSNRSGAFVRELANFVQEVITYQYDSDTTGEEEYPRYPIETLYERQGDCEDTSILIAALLKEFGYEVGFIHVPGHLAVALRTTDDYNDGPYLTKNGHRYLYIESTYAGWNIGEIPQDVLGQPAYVYLIP